MTYDAIVVGARCAGAPTAMLLARLGYRVLLLDAARLPSDMPLSTHLVWQAGAACLARWGLLDAVVASGCPPIRECMVDFGPIVVQGQPVRAAAASDAYAPRRFILDQILLDAARREGVEFRSDFRVTGLTVEDGVVKGIQGLHGGTTVTEACRIVIGADGRNSLIARLVHAEQYNEVAPLQGTYFGYWRDLPAHRLELYIRPGRGVYTFPTNDDLTLVGVNWTIADYRSAANDAISSYQSVIAQCAKPLATRMSNSVLHGDLVGGMIGNVVRKPYGEGWALVGDAGLTMDPCTAAGINNAFRDVELLVEAVDAGLSGMRPMHEAMKGYHTRRDEVSMPIYQFTCDTAAFAPPSAEMAALLGAIARSDVHVGNFLGVLAQTVSPADFFSDENVGAIMQF